MLVMDDPHSQALPAGGITLTASSPATDESAETDDAVGVWIWGAPGDMCSAVCTGSGLSCDAVVSLLATLAELQTIVEDADTQGTDPGDGDFGDGLAATGVGVASGWFNDGVGGGAYLYDDGSCDGFDVSVAPMCYCVSS